MRLDPNDPFDVYFALRLAFVDRPEVRIRTQERMASPDPRGRFAPDPALWSVDAYAAAEFEKLDYHESMRALVNERKLVQAGTLDGGTPSVGESALLARMLWDAKDVGETAAVYAGPLSALGFAGEVLADA